jgi:hypothetical protein
MRELGTPLRKPENGIGWTPDRFRLQIWFPNGLWKDSDVLTWEQVLEKARRLIENAHDPVLSISIVTVDPLRGLHGEES